MHRDFPSCSTHVKCRGYLLAVITIALVLRLSATPASLALQHITLHCTSSHLSTSPGTSQQLSAPHLNPPHIVSWHVTSLHFTVTTLTLCCIAACRFTRHIACSGCGTALTCSNLAIPYCPSLRALTCLSNFTRARRSQRTIACAARRALLLRAASSGTHGQVAVAEHAKDDHPNFRLLGMSPPGAVIPTRNLRHGGMSV